MHQVAILFIVAMIASPRTLVTRARQALERDELDKAIRLAQRATRADPKLVAAWVACGEAHLAARAANAGDIQSVEIHTSKATACFRRACALAPDDDSICYSYALAAVLGGDYAKRDKLVSTGKRLNDPPRLAYAFYTAAGAAAAEHHWDAFASYMKVLDGLELPPGMAPEVETLRNKARGLQKPTRVKPCTVGITASAGGETNPAAQRADTARETTVGAAGVISLDAAARMTVMGNCRLGLSIEGRLYQSAYTSDATDPYDLQSHEIRASLVTKFRERFTWEIRGGISLLFTGLRTFSPFELVLDLKTSIAVEYGSGWATKLRGGIQDVQGLSTWSYLSGWNSTLSASQKWAGGCCQFTLEYSFRSINIGDLSASSSGGNGSVVVPYSYNANGIDIDGLIHLPTAFTVSARAGVQVRNYVRPILVDNIPGTLRQDVQWTLNTTVARQITRQIELALTYMLVVNESNLSMLEQRYEGGGYTDHSALAVMTARWDWGN